MRVLGVDPGKHFCGWGIVDEHGVDSFGYTRPEYTPIDVHAVVVEIPQIYTHRGSKGDPNDLIPLALAAGEVLGFFRRFLPTVRTATVLPAQWKGQVPKEVMQRRLLETVPEPKRENLQLALNQYTKEQRHNVLDGIMLALHGRDRIFK